MSIRASSLVVLAMSLGACSYSLPLAGTAAGRGLPVGAGGFEVSSSFGLNPELIGTLPEVAGANAIPSPDSLTTTAGAFDFLGVAFGLSESVDVGLSFSRGLHATVRVLNRGPVSLSLSPAIHRYSAEQGPGGRVRVTNLNLTALLAMHAPPEATFPVAAYVGAAANRYGAWLEAPSARVSRAALAPSVLAGLRLAAPGCIPWCGLGRSGRPRFAALTLEAHAARIEQRDGRRDIVPTMRLYLTVGGPLRRPSGARLTPPRGGG